MHVCQTERDWICVILKGSITVYFGVLGSLDNKNQIMFLYVDFICTIFDYHERGPAFGGGYVILGGEDVLANYTKKCQREFNISSFLKCFHFVFLNFI